MSTESATLNILFLGQDKPRGFKMAKDAALALVASLENASPRFIKIGNEMINLGLATSVSVTALTGMPVAI